MSGSSWEQLRESVLCLLGKTGVTDDFVVRLAAVRKFKKLNIQLDRLTGYRKYLFLAKIGELKTKLRKWGERIW